MNAVHGSGSDSSLQTLWEDGERMFCRARPPGGSQTVLMAKCAEEYPASATLDRLAHEFALKDQLDRAWAVVPTELVRADGRAVLVFDDPGGELLERQIGTPMETGSVLAIAVAIAAALGKLHQCGLVHKDLKPAHILVNCMDGQVRLTGFGIASQLPRERQLPEPPETIAGTLAYMSPEQTGRMNRSIDSRSDLYGFGVVLYQMLTGVLPFTAADPMEWVHCHVARKAVPPNARVQTVPRALSELVMMLLAKTPEERYQTAAGVEWDLRHCLAEWRRQHRIDDFPPGKHDTPDRLLIPETLYGREREVGTLVAAFSRVASNATAELVLVSGYSGIGKSAVVNELHKVLVAPRGLFASGKFDQYKRDIPYSTLVQAFQCLVRSLLGKRETELAIWRDALREALAPNARLLTDLIPELILIIGDQPPVPELEPNQAQRRFQLVFRRFMGVFAQSDHPLALFLDDLQWLDAATLDLLEDLLTHPNPQHLLLVGAYRSNEVDPCHPLMRKLQAIRRAGVAINEIALGPLDCENVKQLAADALHVEPEFVYPLAQLVHEKTGGNPFFVIQFLHTLADENLLTFDHRTVRWTWDLHRIHGKGYTDNVADLMIAKLTRLPAETQRALQLFACLGNTAGIEMLSKVLELPEQQVRAVMRPAIRRELVQDLSGTYRFAHDRVQEAAYSLIPESSRVKAHLRIGRTLAAQTPAGQLDEAIFEIVNQLNRGSALMSSQEEREQLAGFNLLAGLRAKAATAYESALSYLSIGAELVGHEGWARRQDLLFPLELNRAECEFLTGRVSASEERLNLLSRHAANMPERANVTSLRVDLYMTLDQASRAVAVTLDYLRHVGLDWSPHPAEYKAQEEYGRIWAQLGNRTIDSLIDLPLMTDSQSLATMDVLTKVMPAALFTDGNLWSLVVSRAVNLSLERGNCDGSASAYIRLGMMAGARFGHYDVAFQFGKLGFDLVERRGLIRFRARAYMHFGNVILPMARHLREGRELMRRARDAATDTGDLVCEAYCHTHMTTNLLIGGDPLADVQREAEASLMFAQKTCFGFAVDVSATQLALVRTLRGLTPTFGSFDEEQFDEKQFERHFLENPDLVIAHCWYWIRKLQARFFCGDYAGAVDAALRAQGLLWTSASYLEETEYHFYSALSLAACDGPVSNRKREKSLEAVEAHHRYLQLRSQASPENFGNCAALVAAEIARLKGRDIEAMRLYDEAVHSARTSGFVQNEALANELAYRFYTARGFEKIARVYLHDARQGYRRWGADGKVRQLQETHPYLREEQRAPTPTSTIGAPVEHLDLATVIKVSQSISGEIVLDRLIDMVMRTAIAQAGAERGLLILPEGVELRIAAEATTSGETLEVKLGDVPVSATLLPESVLYHVLRTGESVILDDALAAPAFAVDPYIHRHRIRSMLCLPLMNQAKLIGALYLENNLTTRAFAPSRIAVLRLLASQAATSLENTRLYRDLAKREARIRRLVDANIIGIIVWNADGDILEANDAFLRMVGYEREDLVSGRVRWRDLTPPEWREDAERALAQIAQSGRAQPAEKEYVRKDGTRVPVLVGRAAFDVSGEEGVAFVVDLTERKEAELRLRESYEMLRELTSRRETAREEERKHIAREMHDELGQHLTALRLKASVLRMRLGKDNLELVEQSDALTTLVDETMQVVRGVIASLRPAALDTGIVAALEWLAAGFNRSHRTVCRLRVEDENIAVNEQRAIVLFRVAQEALTNVARHAEASEVIIALTQTHGACVLEVLDNGLGFDPQATRKRSFGLAGMEERVQMLGGQIEITSSPGRGTRIKVTLPDKPAP